MFSFSGPGFSLGGHCSTFEMVNYFYKYLTFFLNGKDKIELVQVQPAFLVIGIVATLVAVGPHNGHDDSPVMFLLFGPFCQQGLSDQESNEENKKSKAHKLLINCLIKVSCLDSKGQTCKCKPGKTENQDWHNLGPQINPVWPVL